MKILVKAFGALFGLALMLTTLFTSCHFVLYSDNDFLPGYFSKYEVTNYLPPVDKADLDSLGRHIMRYLIGKESSIQMNIRIAGVDTDFFNEQDIFHMGEVRDIFISAMRLRNILLLFIIVLFLVTFTLLKHHRAIFFSWAIGSMIFVGALFIVIGIFIWLDFDRAFYIFHRISFNNEAWLFDPNNDFMINILPEGIFFDSSRSILTVYFMATIMEIALLLVAKRGVKSAKT